MNNKSFFRPMAGGFAVTVAALLVAPLNARAETVAMPGCTTTAPAPVKKTHGLHLGRLLSAASQSGVGQILSGGLMRATPAGLIVGAVASTAIQAGARPRAEAAEREAPPCELARD